MQEVDDGGGNDVPGRRLQSYELQGSITIQTKILTVRALNPLHIATAFSTAICTILSKFNSFCVWDNGAKCFHIRFAFFVRCRSPCNAACFFALLQTSWTADCRELPWLLLLQRASFFWSCLSQ